MDVVLPTDASSVAESLGSDIDGGDNVFFRLTLRFGRANRAQRLGDEHGAGPRPEILGRDLAAGDLLQIRVHVFGVDSLPFSFVVDVFEQLFATKLLTALDNAGNSLVGDGDSVLHSALATKLEAHLRADDGDVTTTEGRQAEGFVRLTVFVRADANERGLEQPDHRRHDLVAGETGQLDVGFDALTNLP